MMKGFGGMEKKDFLTYIRVLIEISKGATELADKIQQHPNQNAVTLATARAYLNLAKSNNEAAKKLIVEYQGNSEAKSEVDPDAILRAANDFQLSEKELFGREVSLEHAVTQVQAGISQTDSLAKEAREFQLAEEKRGRVVTFANAVTHVNRTK